MNWNGLIIFIRWKSDFYVWSLFKQVIEATILKVRTDVQIWDNIVKRIKLGAMRKGTLVYSIRENQTLETFIIFCTYFYFNYFTTKNLNVTYNAK